MAEEQPLYPQASPEDVIDDPYSFDRPDDTALETPEEVAGESAVEEEVIEEGAQQDQPFYAKYGYESEEEAAKALENLKTGTTPGHDDLSSRIARIEHALSEPPRQEAPKEIELDEDAVRKKLAEGDALGAVRDIVIHQMSNYSPPESKESRVRNMILDAMIDPEKPDFKELIPDITQYLSKLPNFEDLSDNPLILDVAYSAVKLKKLTEQVNKRGAQANAGRKMSVVAGSKVPAQVSQQVDRSLAYDTMFETGARDIEALIAMASGKKK